MELKEFLNDYDVKNIDDTLKRNYIDALKDKDFQSLVNKLKISDELGMKYTSKLEYSVLCLNNCKKCKNYFECKNEAKGCVFYPEVYKDHIDFRYINCKYKKKIIEEENEFKSKCFGISEELKKARMSLIDINDSKRVDIIKYLKNFYDNYPNNKKGLYLHGSFGSGKTYLVAALINELSKKNYKCIMVYYPELLNILKSSFYSEDNSSFENLLKNIKTCDILLLDDLGADAVTNWSRDEILGTILQYRMDNNLSTFITSNLNLDELEVHLSIVKNNTDKVKARRIIERIKQLTCDMELVSKNRRN